MPGRSEHYDFVIIGGGIFGVYAALYLAHCSYSVCLIEKERELLKSIYRQPGAAA
ncbi:MAG: FAD-binding oxidoreductase [Saprospiraceae bacterium]|nr:FAD-binding oxidoreductase [Saprospiraceae bacterium]